MVAHQVDHKNVKNPINIPQEIIPDPWEEISVAQPKLTRPSWQFPLDPKHEIEAAPVVDGILSPASDPNLLQIPPHQNYTVASNTINILLAEELKINAIQAKTLWESIRNHLILLWWNSNEKN